MRLTIIKSDGIISVDGDALSGFDMSALPDSFHALQWYGVRGEVESINPETGQHQNTEIDTIFPFQSFIDAWQAKRDELDNPPSSPPPVPESITRRQCAIQLLNIGMISDGEAVAMAQTGQPPAAIQAYIDALSTTQQTAALIDLAATSYYRSNPLINALMLANNMTEEQVDDFFTEAAQI